MLDFLAFFLTVQSNSSFSASSMRQLKGKVKENAREKKERKKEFMENKDKVSEFSVLY